MSRWDNSTKICRSLESGLLPEGIDFENSGGRTSLTDYSQADHVATALRKIKNPYIGNKRKIIPFLVQTIVKHKITCNEILDLFSGSAFVSMAMKLLNKRMITNDLLSCSYLNAMAFVKNKDIILTDDEKQYLFTSNNDYDIIIDDKYLNRLDESEIAIISRYYSNAINRWGHPLQGNMKSILAIVYMQNYIMENCFVGGRLNRGQILAEYSHRLVHSRNNGNNMFFNGSSSAYNCLNWTSPIYPSDPNEHSCYNMDAIELLSTEKPSVDLVYIDPPYGGGQSDYGFMYALFDEMLHRRSYDDLQKERSGINRFSSKKDYEDNFHKLLASCQYIPNWIISYNDSSWGSIDAICDIIKIYKSDVCVEEFSYSYNYRGVKNNKSTTKEYLIVVKD